MLARGRYGIEYISRPEREGSGGFGWIVAVICVLALGSLVWTLVGRYRSRADVDRQAAQALPTETSSAPTNAVAPPVEPPQPLPEPVRQTLPERPVRLRNLLMRLEAAEARRDLEMAATTIELIREHPQAADLDDSLARRLGALNMRRLFERRHAKWVKPVVVKRGDSASRIASDHNCTLASLARLNGGKVDRVNIGATLYVMSNPHFTLIVRRRSQTADLMLEDRFFKRYDLCAPVIGKDGVYKTTAKLRACLRELGVGIRAEDRAELEVLMPKGSTVTISEM